MFINAENEIEERGSIYFEVVGIHFCTDALGNGIDTLLQITWLKCFHENVTMLEGENSNGEISYGIDWF